MSTAFFFFFQAEDGIRDGRVTGVQTCALPISVQRFASHIHAPSRRLVVMGSTSAYDVGACHDYPPPWIDERAPIDLEKRSEERRVGKECRYGWWQDH